MVAFGRNDLKIEGVIEEGERVLHLLSGEVSADRLPHRFPEVPEGDGLSEGR